MKNKYKDVSLEEAAKLADPLIEQGCIVHQKYTCGLCNTRQYIDEPNIFYKSIKCEMCGHVTNITKSGCGILVKGPTDVVLKNLLGGK